MVVGGAGVAAEAEEEQGAVVFGRPAEFLGSVSGMLCRERGSGRAGRTVGEPLASALVFFLGGMVIVCWL